MVETMKYVDEIVKKVKSMMKVENAENDGNPIILKFEPKLEPKVMEELDIFINNNELWNMIAPEYYNTEIERMYWEGDDDGKNRKGDFIVKEVRYDLDSEMEDGTISIYLHIKYWRNKINAFDLVIDGAGAYGDDLYGLEEDVYEKNREEYLKEHNERVKNGKTPAWLERYGTEESFWNYWDHRHDDDAFYEWLDGEEYSEQLEEMPDSLHDLYWIWHDKYRKEA